MATSDLKKPKYPSKTCPQCGEFIHARTKQHLACGWVMPAKTAAPKKLGRPKAAPAAPAAPAAADLTEITLEDIRAVKALTDRIGADKVRQLAQVLAK